MSAKRVNITLDGEYAAKLSRLAERAHVSDGTLARSMLSAALDDADPDPDSVTAILEGIPGSLERIERREGEVARGEYVDLDEIA